jgi:hypothetical protein
MVQAELAEYYFVLCIFLEGKTFHVELTFFAVLACWASPWKLCSHSFRGNELRWKEKSASSTKHFGQVLGEDSAGILLILCWAMFPQTMCPDPKTDLYRIRIFPLSCPLEASFMWSILMSRSVSPYGDSRSLTIAGNVLLALERTEVTASAVLCQLCRA